MGNVFAEFCNLLRLLQILHSLGVAYPGPTERRFATSLALQKFARKTSKDWSGGVLLLGEMTALDIGDVPAETPREIGGTIFGCRNIPGHEARLQRPAARNCPSNLKDTIEHQACILWRAGRNTVRG